MKKKSFFLLKGIDFNKKKRYICNREAMKPTKKKDSDMIKTEIRENSAFEAFTAWGWKTEKNEKVFVDEEGHEVSYKYIADHYGEATEENAEKFFAERKAAEPAEEAEHLEAECVGQVLFE